MNVAPIALFAYNRIEHTQKVIEALKKNTLASQSELFIFSDSARHKGEIATISNLRSYLHTIAGFRKINIIERAYNFGLANNITDGVTMVVNQFGKIIVLEDDLVTSPYFLKYMNEALQHYDADDRVACIHGYVYPVKEKLPDTFFLRGADCWGWATWKRGWDLFEKDGSILLNALIKQNLTAEFDYDGGYAFTKMLSDQIQGKNNSWAIRWQASTFLKNKLTLYPGKSLVQNIGNDGSGVHSGSSGIFDIDLTQSPVLILDIPVAVDTYARSAFVKYFFSIKPSLQKRVYYKLKNIFNNVFKNKNSTIL